MTKHIDDNFFCNQQTSSLGITSDDAVWIQVSSPILGLSTGDVPSSPAEMCPICVLLLETQEGIDLFARYVSATLHLVSDGKGNVNSTKGWMCRMCGASGERSVPAFHMKPYEAKEVEQGRDNDTTL